MVDDGIQWLRVYDGWEYTMDEEEVPSARSMSTPKNAALAPTPYRSLSTIVATNATVLLRVHLQFSWAPPHWRSELYTIISIMIPHSETGFKKNDHALLNARSNPMA